MPIEVVYLRFAWNAIELCAGGGGMSTGIVQAGFRLGAVAEIDHDMAFIHQANHRKTNHLVGTAGDIRLLTGKRVLAAANVRKGELHVLAGGIPCQGFSMNGKRDESDPRNSLWKHVPRLASETGAKMVVVENVPGMETLANGAFLQGLLAGLEQMGFTATILRLDAANHGVPQHRRRIFIIGAEDKVPNLQVQGNKVGTWDALRDLPEGLPDDPRTAVGLPYVSAPTWFSKALRGNRKTVRDCGIVDHADFLVERFKQLGAGERDEPTRHRRLHARRPAYTMLAGAKTITACRPIHPYKDRVLTVREGARLFGYPDGYQFGPTVQKSWYALGNSVPPPLARAVFGHLRKQLTAFAGQSAA